MTLTFPVPDSYSRERLAIDVDTSIGGARVCRVPDRLVEQRRVTEQIMIDNGPEFTGSTLDAWAYRRGVKLHFINPGKPIQSSYIERSRGKLRDEYLNKNWLVDLADCRRTIEAWREDYNTQRAGRHDAPGVRHGRRYPQPRLKAGGALRQVHG